MRMRLISDLVRPVANHATGGDVRRKACHWGVVAMGAMVLGLVSGAGGEPLVSVSSNAKLFEAIRSGQVSQVRAVLEQGASVTARDEGGNTPLIWAAQYANLDVMRLLVERGAEINATNQRGASPLMRASYDAGKVTWLLAHGADAKARSGLGNSALLLASRTANSSRAVKALLDSGAELDVTNVFGVTPLIAASAGGDVETVRLLVARGGNPNAQPAPNQGGFIFGGGRSPLMWAAYRGNRPVLKTLLNAGADVNAEGGLGTPLMQAAWADRTQAAQLLLDYGADVRTAGHKDGYTALHWAASTEERDPSLVKLLLGRGANPELGGGAQVDAFMEVLQTPLMLARKRGDTPVLQALSPSGLVPAQRREESAPTAQPVAGERVSQTQVRAALEKAVALLQGTAIESKQAYLRHASKQDCTSCHQQYLPMAAVALAKQKSVTVDAEKDRQLLAMVAQGEFKDFEFDWEPLFHPDLAFTKGYTLLAYSLAGLPADALTDSAVHHLCAIQGRDGQWYNNLPRPPIQSGDIGATALGIQALQRYPLPGRQDEMSNRVKRARVWLASAVPQNTDSRALQLLGLSWAGTPASKLRREIQALLREQRPDGGWGQLPGLASDAYATGQALYALQRVAGLNDSDPSIARGRRYLLQTQEADGSWHVQRRAFPFQPTMPSGFPHGRDSWVSAAGTSWAVMALSIHQPANSVAQR